jgi:hypothetical protein
MKATKIYKSFDDLTEDANSWMAQPERTEASPAQFWNEANSAWRTAAPAEEFASERPLRRWGINE